jgi:hypothetical protein
MGTAAHMLKAHAMFMLLELIEGWSGTASTRHINGISHKRESASLSE